MLLKSSFRYILRNVDNFYVQCFCLARLSILAKFSGRFGPLFCQNVLFLARGMLSFGPKVASFCDILGDGLSSKNYLRGSTYILATFLSIDLFLVFYFASF